MVDILHRVGIKGSSLDDTYKALATREGLAAWRTNNTQGESKAGGVLQFRFGAGGFDMKVLELDPAKRLLWQVIDGPKEWVGTKVSRPSSTHCGFERKLTHEKATRLQPPAGPMVEVDGTTPLIGERVPLTLVATTDQAFTESAA